jgi:hypothetical protein
MHAGDDERPDGGSERRSASADAAALRWTEHEPDPEEDAEPAAKRKEREPERGGRPSASAEAAALRWHDAHADDD